MKRIFLYLTVLLGSLFILSPSASAAGFEAGRIIDNNVFTNKTSMSPSAIQTFLNSKVTACDTWGTQQSEYGGGTRRQWAEARGYYAPYTCLKDFSENGKSAAQIIYDVSQEFTINPQVLIVLLQKEQGLITDTWPVSIQYKTATGYGCPDTAPCDSQYFGLTNQLTWSARMFRAILNNSSTWYTPYVLGNNYIQYSPDSNCGGSNVNIQNRSTQALYNYTPYQPNQGALDAGWGQAPCGAYGNRNFYLYFTSWFGSTTGVDYAWELNTQEVYVDSEMTRPANIDTLAPNTQYYFRVTARNIGNATWTSSGTGSILLGTSSPSNRESVLCDNTWVACNRPARLQETAIAPGDVGSFIFKATTPSSYGTYKEYFNIVAEGVSWLNDIGLHWPLTVAAPSPKWTTVDQTIYTNSARTTPANINTLSPGTIYYAKIIATNTGNTTWRNDGINPVRLGTSSPQDRTSSFYDPSWINANRAAQLQESSVAPGDKGTFLFTLKTPSIYGTFKEYFRPVVEGSAWMNDIGMHWPLTVAPPTSLWSVVSQKTYTDNTMTIPYDTSTTSNGARVYLSIKATNTGNTTWRNDGINPVRLGTSSPQDRTSSFYDPSWINANRAAQLQESSVAPGQVGTFGFWLQAPYQVNNTSIKEYFRPVVEGSAWMNDIGMHQPFTFSSTTTSWQYVSQGAYADAGLTNVIDLTNAQINTKYYLILKARNTSGVTWLNNGNNPIRLGTSSPQDRVSSFYDSSWMTQNRATTLKESNVPPGQIGTFIFVIKTPPNAITSNEYFRPVIEGTSWLTDLGVYWAIKAQ